MKRVRGSFYICMALLAFSLCQANPVSSSDQDNEVEVDGVDSRDSRQMKNDSVERPEVKIFGVQGNPSGGIATSLATTPSQLNQFVGPFTPRFTNFAGVPLGANYGGSAMGLGAVGAFGLTMPSPFNGQGQQLGNIGAPSGMGLGVVGFGISNTGANFPGNGGGAIPVNGIDIYPGPGNFAYGNGGFYGNGGGRVPANLVNIDIQDGHHHPGNFGSGPNLGNLNNFNNLQGISSQLTAQPSTQFAQQIGPFPALFQQGGIGPGPQMIYGGGFNNFQG